MPEDRTCVGTLTCTGDVPAVACTGGLQLMSRSEGRHTISCHSCKFHEGKHVWTNKFSSPLAGIEPGTSSTRSQCANHSAYLLPVDKLMIFIIFQNTELSPNMSIVMV